MSLDILRWRTLKLLCCRSDDSARRSRFCFQPVGVRCLARVSLLLMHNASLPEQPLDILPLYKLIMLNQWAVNCPRQSITGYTNGNVHFVEQLWINVEPTTY